MRLFVGVHQHALELKAALLAGPAQHWVMIRFPIALFIASAAFASTSRVSRCSTSKR